MLQLAEKTISGPAAGPRLLITGGVHGDEFEPMAAIRRLIRMLPGRLLRGRVTLVPVVNEAAYWRGDRAAEDQLDLARTCPGRPDGLPTEQVAWALSALIREADYYIDLHTGGTTLSVWPLVGYMLHPDPKVLDQQRDMARAFGLPIIWGTDARLDGRSLSVARDAGVPAIYAEYWGGARCDEAGVAAYQRGCLDVLRLLGMLAGQPADNPAARVIEDQREGAGHMQVCHPAPVAGFFTPHVQLGDTLRAGETLGTISDLLGDHEVSIPVANVGIVLVLRTFCRVRQGDSLAVVAESCVRGESTPGGTAENSSQEAS